MVNIAGGSQGNIAVFRGEVGIFHRNPVGKGRIAVTASHQDLDNTCPFHIVLAYNLAVGLGLRPQGGFIQPLEGAAGDIHIGSGIDGILHGRVTARDAAIAAGLLGILVVNIVVGIVALGEIRPDIGIIHVDGRGVGSRIGDAYAAAAGNGCPCSIGGEVVLVRKFRSCRKEGCVPVAADIGPGIGGQAVFQFGGIGGDVHCGTAIPVSSGRIVLGSRAQEQGDLQLLVIGAIGIDGRVQHAVALGHIGAGSHQSGGADTSRLDILGHIGIAHGHQNATFLNIYFTKVNLRIAISICPAGIDLGRHITGDAQAFHVGGKTDFVLGEYFRLIGQKAGAIADIHGALHRCRLRPGRGIRHRYGTADQQGSGGRFGLRFYLWGVQGSNADGACTQAVGILVFCCIQGYCRLAGVMSRGRDPRTGYTNSSGNSLGGYLSGFLAILFRPTGSGHQQRIFSFHGVAALQRHGYLALVFHLANQDIHGTGYGPGSTQSVNLGTAFITGNYRDIFGIHRIAGKLQIRKATLADLAIGSGQGQRAAEGTLLDFQLGKTALIGGNGNITGIGRYGRVTHFPYGVACHIQHSYCAADGRTAPCGSHYALHLGIGLGVCLKGHIPSRIQSAAHNRKAGGRILLLCCHGHGVTGIGDIFPVTIHHAMGFFFREVASLHRIVYIRKDIADVHLGLAVTGIIG